MFPQQIVFELFLIYRKNTDFIQKPYKDITPIDVDDFLNNIVNTSEIKNKAFCNMCGILKQTFGYAVSARYISANENPYRVEVNRKKIIPTRKKASTQEVYNHSEKQLLLDEMNRRLQNTPTNTCVLAIMLDFELGTRRGEILAIKNSDIKNGKLHICRQIIDDYDVSDINKAILNALGDNPESSVTTTCRNVENKNVTKRDSNIILFPSNKKAENPCFTRISH